MNKIKVMTVFGTRPEAIKMAPLVLELKRNAKQIDAITTVTAQHREMLDQALATFRIHPDYDLNIMHRGQSLNDITVEVLNKLRVVIEQESPDIILVHGDTTTTFASSLAAFYQRVAIGHVEAGLRTWNKYSPYPEEMNRQMTDDLADLYFAPTTQSRDNLLQEKHPREKIFVTGNTAIDALDETVQSNYHHNVLDLVDPQKKLVLITMHRRENQGKPMRQVFRAIREVVEQHSEVEVVYPVHLSPVVQQVAYESFDGIKRIHLIDPLDVVDFHNLIARSYFVMTDSGGVQEEAPALGKPVLVLRNTTERPEGVQAGTLKLVGTDFLTVKCEMEKLLNSESEYHQMANAHNPYGDGHAAQRIVQAILYYFGKQKNRPREFK